jgi:hypothetical protein
MDADELLSDLLQFMDENKPLHKAEVEVLGLGNRYPVTRVEMEIVNGKWTLTIETD